MPPCADCRLPVNTAHDDIGEPRICASCSELVESDCPVRISPLEDADLELVLAWRSNPEIYRYFRQQDGPLEWEEHVSWFESRPPERHDFIIHYRDRRVGVVNVDSSDDVGIYLGDISAWNKGVATTALNWLCTRFEHRTPLFAEIHEENTASKQLFERCGFSVIDNSGAWHQYTYEP